MLSNLTIANDLRVISAAEQVNTLEALSGQELPQAVDNDAQDADEQIDLSLFAIKYFCPSISAKHFVLQ